MQKHLTEASVAKLSPDPDKRLEIHDLMFPGLRLRVSPKGKKSWSLMYKVAGASIDGKRGKNRRITLGEYPLVSLKAARHKAVDAKELADRGIDPIEDHKSKLLDRSNRKFDFLLGQFIELHAKPNTKKWRDTQYILETEVLPAWRSMDSGHIDRNAIHTSLDDISGRSGAPKAREVRKHLSTFFNWCVDRGLLPFNPMAGMKRRDLQYVPRARVLSMEELTQIRSAADHIGYPFGPVIKLLILSGQRRSEIGNLRRSWLEDGYFEIPASSYKTGSPHIVPITQPMQVIISAQPKWNGGDFLFSTINGRTPSSGFSKTKRKVDAIVSFSDWTFHDIRRSVATHMARIGIQQEHIERVLGHKVQGVAGTYNRYTYLAEKWSALDKWQEEFVATDRA